ncbi:hypothetical protein SNEBB_001694 [Seison nebaliae]|nr:hypothetical protein SNEBB_001694 [Seison nebaliae]
MKCEEFIPENDKNTSPSSKKNQRIYGKKKRCFLLKEAIDYETGKRRKINPLFSTVKPASTPVAEANIFSQWKNDVLLLEKRLNSKNGPKAEYNRNIQMLENERQNLKVQLNTYQMEQSIYSSLSSFQNSNQYRSRRQFLIEKMKDTIKKDKLPDVKQFRLNLQKHMTNNSVDQTTSSSHSPKRYRNILSNKNIRTGRILRNEGMNNDGVITEKEVRLWRKVNSNEATQLTIKNKSDTESSQSTSNDKRPIDRTFDGIGVSIESLETTVMPNILKFNESSTTAKYSTMYMESQQQQQRTYSEQPKMTENVLKSLLNDDWLKDHLEDEIFTSQTSQIDDDVLSKDDESLDGNRTPSWFKSLADKPYMLNKSKRHKDFEVRIVTHLKKLFLLMKERHNEMARNDETFLVNLERLREVEEKHERIRMEQYVDHENRQIDLKKKYLESLVTLNSNLEDIQNEDIQRKLQGNHSPIRKFSVKKEFINFDDRRNKSKRTSSSSSSQYCHVTSSDHPKIKINRINLD